MKNKRYIRLAKAMKGKCDGNCGADGLCPYYLDCMRDKVFYPKHMDSRKLANGLKGPVPKSTRESYEANRNYYYFKPY